MIQKARADYPRLSRTFYYLYWTPRMCNEAKKMGKWEIKYMYLQISVNIGGNKVDLGRGAGGGGYVGCDTQKTNWIIF